MLNHKQICHIYCMYTSTYYVIVILNFIGGMAQVDNNTFDEQTDGKLLYPYHLTCT